MAPPLNIHPWLWISTIALGLAAIVALHVINPLLVAILTYIIRLQCGIVVQIESIGISATGSRIILKNVRYHGQNLTGRIQRLYVTLGREISVEVRGLEGFVYNRSPAYDAIVRHFS